MKGHGEAYCKVCKSCLRAQHSDLVVHSKTKKHQEKMKSLSRSQQADVRSFGRYMALLLFSYILLLAFLIPYCFTFSSGDSSRGRTRPREESLNSDRCPSLATLHGGAFAATTVHVARNSVTTVHGGKFSLAPVQPGASDMFFCISFGWTILTMHHVNLF